MCSYEQPLYHIVSLISKWERLVWDWFIQKLAERIPSVPRLPLEEIFLVNYFSNMAVMIDESFPQLLTASPIATTPIV
jgi:hypothetical protein